MDRLELRRKNFITEFPNASAARVHLRLGRLPRHARQAAWRCSTSTRSSASRPSCATAGSTAASASRRTWRSAASGPSRALGPEGWGMQGGFFESAPGARAPDRLGDRLHRHLAARPGPRDGLRADRGRPARRHARRRGGDPRRHQHRAVRQGHLRLARRSRSAARRWPARPRRCRTRRSGSWPTSSRPRRRTSRSADGSFQVRGAPGGGSMTLADVASEAYTTMDLPEGMEAGPRRALLLRPGRTSSGRSAPTRSSSRSTRRPATSTSSATSRSTTAGRRSTRC